MKRAMILTAAVMAISFATPQVSNAMKVYHQTAVVNDQDDKYKEIKVEELPDAVTKSISNAYTGYKIDKAYKSEDNSYKVNVAMGDLKYQLFYDAKGELIKVEDPTAKADPMLNNGGATDKKSTEPANKGMEPSNKSQSTTSPSEKYPVK